METNESSTGELSPPPAPEGGTGTWVALSRLSWTDKISRVILLVVCLWAAVLSTKTLIEWGRLQPLDMDEFEFVRATKMVAEGKIPYVEFWEHHFPLQWYLMSPLARWATPASVETFRVMRLGNAVLAGGSLVLVFLLSSLRKKGRVPAVTVILLLVAAESFAPVMLRYRIDGPMCFFYLLGVYLLERSLEEGPRASLHSAAAGVALALSGLCSQRAVPGVAMAIGIYLIVPRGKCWGFNRRALPAVASGLGVAGLTTVYWAALGGLGVFWNHNVVTNRLYERLPAGYELPGLSVWVKVLIVKSPSIWVLGFLGLGATVMAILGIRTPSFGFRIALLTAFQLAFLASISSPFGYQLQLFIWLLAILAAEGLAAVYQWRPWSEPAVVIAVVALLLAGSGRGTWNATILPNLAMVQRHQDHILRRLEEVTAPGERVLDGCGWGVNRESGFVFWFLPRLVRVLTAHRAIPPLTEQAIVEGPPAAIVMDSRTVLYLKQVGLQQFVSSHYVALERAIWVPGMSGRLSAGEEKSWTVLATGRHRLVESERQAKHPWFARAFDFPRNTVGPADRFVVDLRAEARAGGERRVMWAVNGTGIAPSEPGGTTRLERGSRLTARNESGEAVAVFAVPERWSEILTMPYFPSYFEPSEEW